MEHTKNNILIRAFFLLFSAAMIGAFSFIKYELSISDWWYYTKVIFLGYLGFLALFCFTISKIDSYDRKYASWITLSMIIVAGVMLRHTAWYLFQTEPISDFARPHECYSFFNTPGAYSENLPWSQRDGNQIYYAQFPGWFPYMRLVVRIYGLLGQDLLWIEIMNSLLAGATIACIYFAIPRRNVALIASMLFAFNPSLVLYSCVTTPDHITIFLIVLAVFFWRRTEMCRADGLRGRQLILYSMALIFCFVLINWFKPLSILFIIVFICYETAVHLFPALCSRVPLKELWKKALSYELVFIIAACGGIFAGNAMLNHWVESTLNTDVVNSTGLYLLWGFSTDENGNYDSSVATDIYVELCEQYDNNLEKVFSDIDQLAKEQIKDNASILPQILWQKYRYLFGGEYSYFAIANTSSEEGYSQSLFQALQVPVTAAMEAYMRAMYMLSAFYALIAVFRKKVDKQVLLAAIMLFGYILVLTLGGVQPRYKSLVVPLWCIISAYTIDLIPAMIRQGVIHCRKRPTEQA